MWTIKNKKKKSQRHICAFHELDGGGVFFGRKKKFYKDANQTENFIGTKTRNNLYYTGGKHC